MGVKGNGRLELNLLVIEDDPADFLLIQRHLKQSGMQAQCTRVADLAELTEALESGGWDAVLSDYSVPRMNFLECFRLVRERLPGTPVLLVSGSVGEERAVELLKLGICDFILKDSLLRLASSIVRGLEEAEEQRARRAAEEEIRHLNRLYAVLSHVNQAIVHTGNRRELLATVCRLVVERGGIDLAWIGWLDPATSEITPVAHFGKDTEILSRSEFCAADRPEGQGNPGKAIREGKPFVCNECSPETCDYPSSQAPAQFGFMSFGSFPLRFQGQVRGVLNLCVTAPMFFREQEVALLEEVTSDVSFALDNIEGNLKRERAERALRESEERLNLALAASRMGVWEWVVPTQTPFWSPECYQILCVEKSEVDIEAFKRSVHPEDLERVMMLAVRALEEKTVYETEFRIVRPTGDVRWVSSLGRGEYDESGSPLRLIGTIQDITERKQAEEERIRIEARLSQAQKMEAIGTLAGGIAHDFNNILGIIMAYSELASFDLEKDSPASENLKQVLQASHRAKQLVRQILAFSHKSEQERGPFHVRPVIKEALALLRAALPSTIEIRPDIRTKDDGDLILGDPIQIHQVIMNLCTNAAHAMDEKGGVLTVSLYTADLALHDPSPSHDPKGSHVMLRVSDTGHGMEKETLERIFEPYFTTKGQGRGTGLGLAVVHGIVKSHGGEIKVRSLPGQGTAFNIHLPRFEGTAVDEIKKTELKFNFGIRVLLVDDEPSLLDVGKRMLEMLGCIVTSRAGALEALGAFRSEPDAHDLVITDQTMPGMTGLDLATELIKVKPEIPIILMTGFGDSRMRERASAAGILKILPKPFSRSELAEAVHAIVRKDREVQ